MEDAEERDRLGDGALDMSRTLRLGALAGVFRPRPHRGPGRTARLRGGPGGPLIGTAGTVLVGAAGRSTGGADTGRLLVGGAVLQDGVLGLERAGPRGCTTPKVVAAARPAPSSAAIRQSPIPARHLPAFKSAQNIPLSQQQLFISARPRSPPGKTDHNEDCTGDQPASRHAPSDRHGHRGTLEDVGGTGRGSSHTMIRVPSWTTGRSVGRPTERRAITAGPPRQARPRRCLPPPGRGPARRCRAPHRGARRPGRRARPPRRRDVGDVERVAGEVVGGHVATQRIECPATVIPRGKPVGTERQEQQVSPPAAREPRVDRGARRGILRGEVGWLQPSASAMPRSGIRASGASTSADATAIRAPWAGTVHHGGDADPEEAGRERCDQRQEPRSVADQPAPGTRDTSHASIRGPRSQRGRRAARPRRPAARRSRRRTRPDHRRHLRRRAHGQHQRHDRRPTGARGGHDLGVPDPAQPEERQRQRQEPLAACREGLDAARVAQRTAPVQRARDDPRGVDRETAAATTAERLTAPRRRPTTQHSAKKPAITPPAALRLARPSHRTVAGVVGSPARARRAASYSHGNAAYVSNSGQWPMPSRSATKGFHT